MAAMERTAVSAVTETPTQAPSVPRLWPGSTIVCLASGPSLTPEDVAFCQVRARVIAIKDTVRLAPWADVLYGCGCDTGQWWQRIGSTLNFPGLAYTLDKAAAKWATPLRNAGPVGLETDPTGLRTGSNSGYQAINLAVHLGAARIVLLGYDMQVTADRTKDHFYGTHPWQPHIPVLAFLPHFQGLVDPLRALGIEVVNATRQTALTCFPRAPLAEALA